MCSLLFAALSSVASPRLWLLLADLLAVLLHWLGCQAVHWRLSTGDQPHQLATLLSTGDGPLETVHWILSTGDCPLKTTHWRLSTADCPL